jgi:phage-related protein
MALNNYQFQFGSFLFGGAGSPFQIIDVDGLAGLPDLRTQDDNRGYNDGMFSGRDFYAGRTIVITTHIFAGNGLSAQQNLALFQAALNTQQQGTTSLNFQLAVSDTQKVISARVRSRKVTIDPEYTFGYIRTQTTLFCPDPRYYDATLTSLSLTPAVAGGRTYNRTYNLTYPAYSNTASGSVVNSGWSSTYPTITIVGPIVSPVITNFTTGESLTVAVTMASTDTLVLDLLNKTVTLNGSTARNLLTTASRWFGISPGTTLIGFTGNNGTYTAGVTTATIAYRSAYV